MDSYQKDADKSCPTCKGRGLVVGREMTRKDGSTKTEEAVCWCVLEKRLNDYLDGS